MPLVAAGQAFIGANTRRNARLLPDGVGQEAANIDNRDGGMKGFPGLGSPVATIAGSGVLKSIYRWGRDNLNPSDYWIGSVDDLDFARSMLAEDANERTYVTGGGVPRYFDATQIGSPPYPTGYTTLGVPAPSGTMTLALGTAGTGTDETRIYLDTFVRANGDESAPNASVPSIVVKGGSTVNISNLAPVPSGTHGITKRRIYVSTGSTFQRVLEQNAALTTATDSGARGLSLMSGGREDVDPGGAWSTPPDDLVGLTPLWNGMMLGGVGKSIQICYPYKPHAWPLKYQYSMPDTFVGAATWGQNVLIATTGYPRVSAGSAPGSMNPVPIYLARAACVSKRTVKGVGHGVCWVSNTGICYHGQRGSAIITEGLISESDWQAMNPSQMFAANWGVYYLVRYSATKVLMIDTTNPVGFITLDLAVSAFFEDTVSGKLYVATMGAGLIELPGGGGFADPREVREFAAGSAMTASYKSKEHRVKDPVCPAQARVIASQYPVTFSLWADGSPVVTDQSVTSEDNFPLPGGYMARYFEVKVSGTGPIEGYAVSTDVESMP